MSSPTPYRILINGWYGHYNAGDDAILQVFEEQVGARIDSQIEVLSEQPANIATSARLRAAPHPSLLGRGALRTWLNGDMFRHLRRIQRCDLFVLGGGGLLRDNTSWRNLLRLLDELWLAKLLGRKTMLYAIGVGPFKSRWGKLAISLSVRLCDVITVRSERGAELLRSVGVPAERINVVADPAFLLEAHAPLDPELLALLDDGDKIGVYPTVSLVEGLSDDGHVRRLAAALDTLVEQQQARFVALPMRVCDELDELDDVKMSYAIKAAMRYPDALQVYAKRLSAAELKWATAHARMNITVRLHAMIFSLGASVPVVAINYEPKVANVFSTFGSPDKYLVEMDGDMAHALPVAVAQCLANLEPYRQLINECMVPAAEAARLTFTKMQELHSGASLAAALPHSHTSGRP